MRATIVIVFLIDAIRAFSINFFLADTKIIF